MMAAWEAGLRAAGPLDGVYCVLHGAGLTTEDDDPEGTLLGMVRRVVGPDVPVVATFDLHANVSEAMVARARRLHRLPHQPASRHARARRRGGAVGAPAGGRRAHAHRARAAADRAAARRRMLTGADAPVRPYGELIDLGQARMAEPPYAGRVLNVSVMGGFAYADTPFNGLTVGGHRDRRRGGCGAGARDRGGRMGAARAVPCRP